MKKIYLVSGGTGFLGNTIVKQLEEKGETVYAFARSRDKAAQALRGAKSQIFYGDILNKQELELMFNNELTRKMQGRGEAFEFVFIHTASQVKLSGSTSTMFRVNTEGTRNIIELCKKYKARLVYVSSVHAITPLADNALMSEPFEYNPKNVKGKYSKSKATASAMVLRAAQEGLDAVITLPSCFIGPNDYSFTHMTQTIKMYMGKKIGKTILGGYDFIDVRDVAQGIIEAAEKGVKGESYLLTNKYYSTREFFDVLYDLTKVKPIMGNVPRFFAYMGLPFVALGSAISGKRPLYSANSLHALKSNSNFSHAKASQTFDFRPRSLKESLDDTVKFLNTTAE